jgi:hypothetical protein
MGQTLNVLFSLKHSLTHTFLNGAVICPLSIIFLQIIAQQVTNARTSYLKTAMQFQKCMDLPSPSARWTVGRLAVTRWHQARLRSWQQMPFFLFFFVVFTNPFVPC